MVDKNLFLYDLAIVAIMKNERRYLKEWLDYHLAAGVDHFYIYDNDSTDNQREVAAPYVKAGLVDYINAPGRAMQYAAYDEAIKRFKFHCRYMAFIDGDEFIYPKAGGSITETVDKILSRNPKAAGLAIHWHCFGSNGQEKADYSRGVLERFTRRAPKDFFLPAGTAGNNFTQGNCYVKSIVDPRKINFFDDPHRMNYFENFYGVDENLRKVETSTPFPIATEKIVVNHYYVKSKEEFTEKISRGSATRVQHQKKLEWFDVCDRNDEFDDGILHYRDERTKTYQPPDNSKANERLLKMSERLMNALMENLSPTLLPMTTTKFFAGKMETFLTCREVAAYLKTKLADDAPAKFFEETAIKAALKSINGMTLSDARIFIGELPKLLSLPYPAVKNVRNYALQLIPQMKTVMRKNVMWKDYVELDYINDLVKLGG